MTDVVVALMSAAAGYYFGCWDTRRSIDKEVRVDAATQALAQELARIRRIPVPKLKEPGLREISPGVFVANKSTSIFADDPIDDEALEALEQHEHADSAHSDYVSQICKCDDWQSCAVCRAADIECRRCNDNGCVHCQGD